MSRLTRSVCAVRLHVCVKPLSTSGNKFNETSLPRVTSRYKRGGGDAPRGTDDDSGKHRRAFYLPAIKRAYLSLKINADRAHTLHGDSAGRPLLRGTRLLLASLAPR